MSEKTIEGRCLRMKIMKDKMIDLPWIVNHRQDMIFLRRDVGQNCEGILPNNSACVDPESRKLSLG